MEAHADDNNEVINAQRDTTTLGTSVLLCKDSTGLEQAAPERQTTVTKTQRPAPSGSHHYQLEALTQTGK